MRLYIKQKVWSFKDRFSIKDDVERDRYYVEGEFFSFAKKLRLFNKDNEEQLYIEQSLWRFLPEYNLYEKGEKVATVKKDFTLFKNNYTILGPDWHIEGSVMAHDYMIKEGDKVIADINKKWLSWGDTYEINIHDEQYVSLLLGIVVVIDAVIAQENPPGQ
ncbi:LURP-one-related/scramblase family protein [Alkalibacterium putridalgicola]|uniref:LURP-one-related/scramblase family protein n=1 Tax=Alkalibacterium putridalgicola TaxID=426703 RepID=UPI0034CF7000